MNYFSITSSFMPLGLVICIAISMVQPTLKRKVTILCSYLPLLLLLLAYPACMERHKLSPGQFWLTIAQAVFVLVSPIWISPWANRWIRKIEEMKQRSVKRAAYIESLRYQEDEEPAQLMNSLNL